jgi:hypothetical protein
MTMRGRLRSLTQATAARPAARGATHAEARGGRTSPSRGIRTSPGGGAGASPGGGAGASPGGDTFEWNMRRAAGPTDEALYQCGCGYQFTARVATTVACPNCGVGQAW